MKMRMRRVGVGNVVALQPQLLPLVLALKAMVVIVAVLLHLVKTTGNTLNLKKHLVSVRIPKVGPRLNHSYLIVALV